MNDKLIEGLLEWLKEKWQGKKVELAWIPNN